MSKPSPAERLQQIAQGMRLALASCRKWYGGGTEFERRVAMTLGYSLDRAVAAGGFAGPEYATFCLFVEDMKESHPEHWRESVGALAAVHLLPQVGVDVREGVVPLEVVFDGLADLIDAEAEKLEAGGGGSPDGPWSQPDTPKRWAKVFGVNVQTIKRRFQDGKIRNKKLSDRSYQVHVDDVPRADDSRCK